MAIGLVVEEAKKEEKGLVYSVTLGAGEEDDNTADVLEVIRSHLDAAAQTGRRLVVKLFSI